MGLGDVSAAREFASLEEALGSKPDAVIVSNPTSLHVETACAALDAGAHVLVEKPLGHTLEHVPELLQSARGMVLMVGYNFRFHPGLRRMRELLHAGAIGRPLSVRAAMGEYLPDWHPWEDFRQSYAGKRALGGGAVLTQSHELDAVCWMLGAPCAVTAVARRSGSLEIDAEDVAEIVLEWPNGAIGSVHVDYLRRPPQRSIEIVGEEGVLRWDYDDNRVLRSAPGTREWIVEQGDPRFERNVTFLSELKAFAARIRGEDEAMGASGEQGAAVLAVALAALRSSEEARRIDLTTEPPHVQQWLSSL